MPSSVEASSDELEELDDAPEDEFSTAHSSSHSPSNSQERTHSFCFSHQVKPADAKHPLSSDSPPSIPLSSSVEELGSSSDELVELDTSPEDEFSTVLPSSHSPSNSQER